MIPKRIITAWFGKGEKLDIFKHCLESWHEMHPDWDFVEITEDNCDDLMSEPFMVSALSMKEYVKCTELARLWAVKKYGGIYMDLDVEVVKPMFSLLNNDHFFVREPGGLVNGAIFGSIPEGEVVSALVGAFPSKGDAWGSPVNFGPLFLTSNMPKNGNVLPPDVAFPYNYNQKDPGIYPEETIVVHRWAGSWAPAGMRRQEDV